MNKDEALKDTIIEIVASALSDNDVRPRANEILSIIEEVKEQTLKEAGEWIKSCETRGGWCINRWEVESLLRGEMPNTGE